jgi:hypothetical protein
LNLMGIAGIRVVDDHWFKTGLAYFDHYAAKATGYVLKFDLYASTMAYTGTKGDMNSTKIECGGYANKSKAVDARKQGNVMKQLGQSLKTFGFKSIG